VGALLVGPVLGSSTTPAERALPRVSDVSGRAAAGTVVFSWTDPGVAAGDNYVVTPRGGASSMQRETEFTVQTGADGAAPVCITVSVNRDGRTGVASTEKCVDPAPGTP
ncbi:MAG: serine/threonine protein kinase, partial [Cryobacterium sp.]